MASAREHHLESIRHAIGGLRSLQTHLLATANMAAAATVLVYQATGGASCPSADGESAYTGAVGVGMDISDAAARINTVVAELEAYRLQV
jgi:hypothetical protein